MMTWYNGSDYTSCNARTVPRLCFFGFLQLPHEKTYSVQSVVPAKESAIQLLLHSDGDDV